MNALITALILTGHTTEVEAPIGLTLGTLATSTEGLIIVSNMLLVLLTGALCFITFRSIQLEEHRHQERLAETAAARSVEDHRHEEAVIEDHTAETVAEAAEPVHAE